MRCLKPRTVGFASDGKTICWSQKHYSKEYATFQLPCGKCLECRLDYARQWAVRCVHEAQMHEENSFITLTYSDENLKSPKLIYEDFQLFMKKLRHLKNDPISFFVTGEYGEETKRPHWHALVFNWYPKDATYFRSNERGDKIFKSATLDRTWGLGHCEVGAVTFESAGYCARYAAKKLCHGRDADHEFHPISKKSSKHAIGKKWLEKYWYTDCFAQGQIVLADGRGAVGIPRYYEKWLKENQPDYWLRYVTHKKDEKISFATERADLEHKEWLEVNNKRRDEGKLTHTPTEKERRGKILKQKFELLQKNLKL